MPEYSVCRTAFVMLCNAVEVGHIRANEGLAGNGAAPFSECARNLRRRRSGCVVRGGISPIRPFQRRKLAVPAI